MVTKKTKKNIKMILRKQEIIEKHPNGKISYVETRAIIAPISRALYPNHRTSPDGTLWIRIGVNKKYNRDGKLMWEIWYDDHGNKVKR